MSGRFLLAQGGLCLLTALLSVLYIQCLGDDTYIYMRMLGNFLKSGRFEYNVGEPCYAMTSVTWFLSWAWTARWMGSIDAARYVLSPLFHALAFCAVAALAARLIRRRGLQLVVLAAVFLDPFYLRWFWAGWEMSPKIAAAAFALVCLLRVRPDRTVSFLLAGLSAGLAILTRPEMFLLAGLGGIYLLARRPSTRVLAGFALYVAGVTAVAAPWMVYAWKTFGWAVPHTVYAKTGGALGAAYLRTHGAKLAKIVLVPALPLLAAALWTLLGPRVARARWATLAISNPESRAWRRDWALVFLWGCGVFGYLAGASYIESIKTGQFSPFLLLALASLMDRSQAEAGPWDRRGPVTAVIISLAAVSALVQAKLYVRYSLLSSDFRQGEDRRFIRFATRVGELTPPDARIGIWELGVVGYFSQRHMIDFVGLATPGIVACKRSGGDYVQRYLDGHGGPPEYVVDAVPRGQETVAGRDERDFFGRRYVPILAERVRRIGGREGQGDYYLYVLYERQAPGSVAP